jgi:hypothetical protein
LHEAWKKNLAAAVEKKGRGILHSWWPNEEYLWNHHNVSGYWITGSGSPSKREYGIFVCLELQTDLGGKWEEIFLESEGRYQRRLAKALRGDPAFCRGKGDRRLMAKFNVVARWDVLLDAGTANLLKVENAQSPSSLFIDLFHFELGHLTDSWNHFHPLSMEKGLLHPTRYWLKYLVHNHIRAVLNSTVSADTVFDPGGEHNQLCILLREGLADQVFDLAHRVFQSLFALGEKSREIGQEIERRFLAQMREA